jgi:photosystem II stability/assembly factor-like uncharacterized protein
VLFGGENVGCSGLSMDAHDPRTLFAGLWQVEMHTWGEIGGGPGSGLWVTHDGGSKWTRIEQHGLPKSPVGKIDVAVAPTNSSRVYALIQTADQGSVWRSDDGGGEWHAVNYQRGLIGRAGYYIRLAVSPTTDSEVLVANSSFWQSLDAGENFHEVNWGGDTHDIWIDPKNPDRFVITDDLGLIITTVHGKGFHRVTLPIGQMYHVAVDNQVPYYFYSNMQDNGTMRGPIVAAEGEARWDRRMGGCESGFTLPDLVDPNVVWATCYGNTVTRWDARYREAHSLSPWLHTLDSPPDSLKYRCHWTPPLAIDPFDHETVYYGCQVIFRTTNSGQSWSVVSPDLSTQDPAHVAPSGGVVGDNLGQFYGEVVFAIAPSPVQKGLIWAGTNDGQVWYTRDGTANWVNVTRNLPGLPPIGTVTSIAPSAFDAGTAYVSVDFHLVDNRDPFIYKTSDFGKTWKRITGNLPHHSHSYVRSVAEDPNHAGLLFAGTGNGLYYSLDDGGHWSALAAGLPHAPVTWAVVQKNFHDLVVSTYGRGLYVLEDITPLEQMADAHGDGTTLYAPRQAYRFVKSPEAIVNFRLKSDPKQPVKLEVLDAGGGVVRTLEPEAKAGLNRVRWDLHYDSPRLVELRTAAPQNPHIWLEPRFRDTDSRPITHWGIAPAEVGPIAAPGRYTVRLTVDDASYSQPLVIEPDPHAPGTVADIQQSVKTLLQIRADISHVADEVNQIEWLRRQLEVVEAMLRPGKKADKAAPAPTEEDEDDDEDAPKAPPRALGDEEKRQRAAMLQAAEGLDQKLKGVEHRYVAEALLNSDDKYFIDPHRLYLDLLWLNAEVGTGGGDVAGSADFAPTETQLGLLAGYEAEMAAVDTDYRKVLDEDLPAANRALTSGSLAPLVATR